MKCLARCLAYSKIFTGSCPHLGAEEHSYIVVTTRYKSWCVPWVFTVMWGSRVSELQQSWWDEAYNGDGEWLSGVGAECVVAVPRAASLRILGPESHRCGLHSTGVLPSSFLTSLPRRSCGKRGVFHVVVSSEAVFRWWVLREFNFRRRILWWENGCCKQRSRSVDRARAVEGCRVRNWVVDHMVTASGSQSRRDCENSQWGRPSDIS